MPRGRKPTLKVGDGVHLTDNMNKIGVIVHISTDVENSMFKRETPYCVHWYQNGRGYYSKTDLKKAKATSSKPEAEQ